MGQGFVCMPIGSAQQVGGHEEAQITCMLFISTPGEKSILRKRF
jgi:hypothetical protein